MSSPDGIFDFSPPPSRTPSPEAPVSEITSASPSLFDGPFSPFFGATQPSKEFPKRKIVATKVTTPQQIPSPHPRNRDVDDLVFERMPTPTAPLQSPSSLTAALLAFKTPPKTPAE